IDFLPAHPHEGAISVPPGENQRARVAATGKSAVTGRPFNIAVVFNGNGPGRAVVDSSFHHFADYNLDPRLGWPSFVTEPSSSRIWNSARPLGDAKTYMETIARWLAG